LRHPPGPSWWDRVEPWATKWHLAADDSDMQAVAPTGTPLPVVLKTFALLHLKASAAAAPVARLNSPDTDATRLGKAVHRALEWATSQPLDDDSILSRIADAAAQEFNTSAQGVAQLARVILKSPACARFFSGPHLRWHGNEVPVSDAGEALRIDRLVHIDDDEGSTWWVLDYKLQHAPQELEAYRDQLKRYRGAVRRAQPNAKVRCAFVTGAGAVIEIE
jgi:ATP-dependent helicase/nuclease subunit A